MAGRALLIATTALVLLLGAAIFLGLATSSVGESPVTTLDELRRAGIMFLEDEHAFLVYNDGGPLALSDDAQHLDGEHAEWCERSQMFETPTHGEKFDDLGYYFGGPAQRGLDRFAVRIRGDAVYVDFEERVAGPERGSGPAFEPKGSSASQVRPELMRVRLRWGCLPHLSKCHSTLPADPSNSTSSST